MRPLPLLFTLLFTLGLARADVFPKHEPERQFAELKVYDAEGHPWRVAQEDWTGARRRVAEDPAWTKWLRSERAQVDAWIAHHQDHVEWAAGWSHDGVSPKDGSRLNWVDQIPGKEITHFTSASDPQVEITPKLFAWWVVTFRNRHVETMVRAARLHRLTGDERYARWVIDQMDFYAANLDRWAMLPTAKGARLFWQTLSEATGLVQFTEAVRLLGDTVPAAQRQRWRTTFFQPEVELLNRTFRSIHNIATWQRCAVAEVALLYDDEPLWRQMIDGEFGVRQQIAGGITSEYLWYEQSFGYNSYVVSALNSLFTAASLHGRAPELAAEMATAENLMLSPTYLRFPNGQLPNPADNRGILTAPERGPFLETYRVLPTTIGLTDAAGTRNWNTLLDPPPASPHPVTLPAVTSRNLESSRMALLKSGRWQVFFHYGQLTRSHSEAEALNFSAFYGDTDITHDPGVVGYGSPLYRGYYTRGLCHNVPLIDGEGQEPPQRGELLAYSATPVRVSAAQPHYTRNAGAGRALEIKDDALVDTVTVETRAPRRLGLALHVQGRAQLPAGFTADATLPEGRAEPFRHWRDARAATFRDHAEIDVAYGSVVMRVTFTAPGEFRLWHASSPDVPPARRESFYLELLAPAAKATFTTTFTPQPTR
ncbi:heparinase II/III family protein [Opitutus sp. ER46]|uniref:alginate lyase family protein n=1 Tax=Opitutus sp. ER46 TaxID=2161864 RepID=UPI000D2FB534|nr:heparinase II/III family protein [Opitutus sp. ER46]PTX98954.1 heparinase [Opitutus sp. ER46]